MSVRSGLGFSLFDRVRVKALRSASPDIVLRGGVEKMRQIAVVPQEISITSFKELSKYLPCSAEFWQCKRKQVYYSKTAAVRASISMMRKHRVFFTAYQCRFCGDFHVGKTERGLKK